MLPITRRIALSLLGSLTFTATADAQITMPKVFGNHMVLQREEPVHVWGWASRGESVTVTFRGESETATPDAAGRWDAYLSPGAAGGPFKLVVKGTSEVAFDDILVGDVWVASGQSNMEMPVAGWDAKTAGGRPAPMNDSAKEIAAADHPQIRLLRLEKQHSYYPMDDILTSKGWQVCSPETVGPFSASAYFFARDVQANIKVPIGVIQSTWGGTAGQGWTSLQTLTEDANLLPLFADYDARIRDQATKNRQIDLNRIEEDAARKAGKTASLPRVRTFPESWRPGGLYNGMIAPLTPFRIKGFLWYQGETDWEICNGRHYTRLLTALIGDWRRSWKQGDLPFIYAQASTASATPLGWPPVRECQRRALAVANTGMAVTADIGNEDMNVHPSNKQDVGRRLALIARANVYGEPIEYSGPAYRQTTKHGNTLRIWFDHAKGLKFKNAALDSFEIAGADHQFVPATAEIRGESIIVSSPKVASPIYVRYAWKTNPSMTLYNDAGLPASPFTSEEAF